MYLIDIRVPESQIKMKEFKRRIPLVISQNLKNPLLLDILFKLFYQLLASMDKRDKRRKD
jgi:hypothetical protein